MFFVLESFQSYFSSFLCVGCVVAAMPHSFARVSRLSRRAAACSFVTYLDRFLPVFGSLRGPLRLKGLFWNKMGGRGPFPSSPCMLYIAARLSVEGKASPVSALGWTAPWPEPRTRNRPVGRRA